MSETTDPRGKSASQIEDEVERTRARVTDTIEALRERMSPGQVVDQLMDYAKDSGGADFVRNLGTSVRDNPLPLLLIGAGIGWMMMSNGRRPVTYPATSYPPNYGTDPQLALPPPPASSHPGMGARAADTMHGAMDAVRGRASSGAATLRGTAAHAYEVGSDTASSAASGVRSAASSVGSAAGSAAGAIGSAASSAAEAVSDAASRVGEAVSSLASQASDSLSSVGHSARSGYRDVAGQASRQYGVASDQAGMLADRARDGWQRMATEQPLLLGALGLAMGAALGAILPRTRTEDRLMGEASDAVASRASEAVQQGYEQVKETAVAQLEQGKAALAETYEKSQERLKGDMSVENISKVVTDAAAEVKEKATEAARGMKDEAHSTIDAAGERAGAAQGESTTGPAGQGKPPQDKPPQDKPGSGASSSPLPNTPRPLM